MAPRKRRARRRRRALTWGNSQIQRIRRIGPRRLVPIALLLVIGGVMAAAILPSCDSPAQHRIETGPGGKQLQGASERPGEPPLVRVRLTRGPADEVVVSTSGAYRVLLDGKVIFQSAASLGPTSIRHVGGTWQIGAARHSGGVLELHSGDAERSKVRLGDKYYRGSFAMHPAGDQVLLVNHLDMESYLYGLRELYGNWDRETHRALAIAARTFARYNALATTGALFDVADDQSSQVYGGFSGEMLSTKQAADDTRGMMLYCTQDGRPQLFLSQYSSCCGGTVNGAYVLRDCPQIPPLVGGQRDADCAAAPHYTWPMVRISKAEIYKALLASNYPAAPTLGGVADVKVASLMPYDRPVWVDIIGRSPGKSMRLRADDLRLVILRSKCPGGDKLFSMNCSIRSVGETIEFYGGRGFGHGVGLCQFGAQGKAAKGWTAEKILDFYYPGSKIKKAW